VRRFAWRAAAEGGSPHARLDLYDSAQAEAAPLVVLWHGGGWCAGEPGDLAPLAEALAVRGCVVACPAYRLAPEHPWPAQLDDARAALGWLWEHAARLGADARRTVLGGHSAGAHLAALLALDTTLLTERVDHVRGLACLSGVFDLTALARSTWMRAQMVRPTFGNEPARWHAASPLARVRAGAPPCWLRNAEIDWGLQRQAAAFAAALGGVGVATERTTARGRNHMSLVACAGQPGDLTAPLLAEFVARVTASR
jgi:acetyl esterase/lipase